MSFELLAFVTSWVAYFGLAMLIMWVDARRQAARERDAEIPTYADRRIWPYFVFAIFCGPVPLIMYFYGTRRTGRGALIGVGVALAHSALIGVLSFALMSVAGGIETRRACTDVPVRDDGFACAYRVASSGQKGYPMLERARQNGGFRACAYLIGAGEARQDTDAARTGRARVKAIELCRQNAERDMSCPALISGG
jgi:hypothetical protein